MPDKPFMVSNVPPVIRERDGKFYVEVAAGNVEVLAPLGDGSWFLAHFLERIVEPALKSARRT